MNDNTPRNQTFFNNYFTVQKKYPLMSEKLVL